MSATSWAELAGRTLARQFPTLPVANPPTALDVAATLAAIGPVQAQTARSPFLALAARLPGIEHDTIADAYENLQIVRGSNLRGTVHTCIPSDHPLLEVATRTGQRSLWQRTIKPAHATLEQIWAGIEEYAHEEYRTPAELLAHLIGWLDRNDPGHAAQLSDTAGRYFAFGHGGLLRRPLTGGWAGQGAAGYRTATALLGDRTAVLADPDSALTDLVARHLAAFGPAGRRDIAWWSGVGLRAVDAALERLAERIELIAYTAPDGEVCVDLADAPGPVELPGVRLLPEFDALLCGFAPPARARFVDPDHYRRLWSPDNGLLAAPILVDGRLTGYWRLSGNGRRRTAQITWFPRTRRPRTAESDEQLAAVERAYGVEITGVQIERG
ncbi:winged helix DNA-binding domain-containing protein [Skermania piniformis]|uniref:Winged helix DNA-binding domain-containing protein n=1 Tax=Skermania pinensis TaxID=39122 RepID=A0ABX8S8I2_9ACTN|nr:winged helix DNA-binding domain-containing protein [Skermania piniformis]QXQ13309.1 winged helix DNA-binding domain-containing protein [Skermania piniformis]